MILNVICMILCKRIPEGVVTFNTDLLSKKIKLLPLPKGLGYDPLPMQKTKSINEKADPNIGQNLLEQFKSGAFNPKLNTGEACVVRVRIQTKKLTPSEVAEEDRKKNTSQQKHKRDHSTISSISSMEASILYDEHGEPFMELDQEDKALAITARPKELPYTAYVLHEYPQRVQRMDFVEQIVRQCFDFFDGHPERQQDIFRAAEREAKITEEQFIAETCSEYEMPKFDLPINAPDYDN